MITSDSFTRRRNSLKVGFIEMIEGFPRPLYFIAAHRTSQIKDNAQTYWRIFIAEEGDLLRLFVVKYGKGVLLQPRYETAILVCDCDVKGDQIRVGDDSVIALVLLSCLRRRGRFWFGRFDLSVHGVRQAQHKEDNQEAQTISNVPTLSPHNSLLLLLLIPNNSVHTSDVNHADSDTADLRQTRYLLSRYDR